MKKRILAFLLVLLMLSFALGAAAAEGFLHDEAGLLTHTQNAEISAKLEQASSKHGIDIVIFTEDDSSEMSRCYDIEDYITKWYEASGFFSDGVLLYINMETRDWYIRSFGNTAITDFEIDCIADVFLDPLSSGEYADAFDIFVMYVDEFSTTAQEGGLYDEQAPSGVRDYSEDLSEEPFDAGITLVISLAIGFVVALIVTGVWRGQLKSVSSKDRASDYVKSGSLNITTSQDLFLYRNINRRAKPRDTGGGGGGSKSHHSSSGRSYGSRGGKF